MFIAGCGINISNLKKICKMNTHSVVKTKRIGQNTLIHPFCFIEEDVEIGKNVIIHPGCVIAQGVVIGDNVEISPNAYIGKEPKNPGSLTRELKFKTKTFIGKNCLIGPGAVIYCDVNLGNNCLIGDNASIRETVNIGEYSVIGRNVTVNYNTTIGKRVKIMDLTVITGNCKIGDNVFISCLVATTNDKRFGKGEEFDVSQMHGPVIEDNVIIGAGANILHGTILGNGCVVAAGSIVTKNIPGNVLVMGSPAKIIKELK